MLNDLNQAIIYKNFTRWTRKRGTNCNLTSQKHAVFSKMFGKNWFTWQLN